MPKMGFIGTEAPTGRIKVRPPGSPVSTAVSDKTATIRMNVPRGSLSWHVPEEAIPSIRIAAPVSSVIPVAGEGRKIDKKTLFRASNSASPNSSATMDSPDVDTDEYETGDSLSPLSPRQQNKRRPRKKKKRTAQNLDDTQALLRVDDGLTEIDHEELVEGAKTEDAARFARTNNWPLVFCSSLFCLLGGVLIGAMVVAPRMNAKSDVSVKPEAEPDSRHIAVEHSSLKKGDTTSSVKKAPLSQIHGKVPRVKRLVLIDAHTGAEIQEITADAKINVSGRGPVFDIRAETIPEKVGFVSFAWNGTTLKLDQEPPYSLLEDKSVAGRRAWYPRSGVNSLLVIPYIRRSKSDTRGEEMRVNFSVIGFSGLLGHYYSTPNLEGTPKMRTDPRINFDWGSRPPIRGIIGSGYSVRWEGMIIPRCKGHCAFTVIADGNVRMWIGKEQVIKESKGTRIHTGSYRFKNKGRVPIRLDFLNVAMRGVIQLNWKHEKTKGARGEVVPTEALLPIVAP